MAEIRGVVLNKHSRRPLKGASVYVNQVGVDPAAHVSRLPTTTTSDAGVFLLPDIPAGKFFVIAQFDVRSGQKGIVFYGRSGPLELGEKPVEIEIEVDVKGGMLGQVLDASDGSPIRAALVGILEEGGGQMMSSTAEEGGFLLTAIRPGCYTVVSEALGYEKHIQKVFVPDASEKGLLLLPIFLVPLPALQLPDTGIVRGFVLNEVGNPAIAAEVTIVGGGIRRSCVVDRNYFDYRMGHFEFYEVPEGEYRIFAVKAGMEPTDREVVVKRGRQTWIDLRMRALPAYGPPEIESFVIEPRSLMVGQAVRFEVKLSGTLNESACVSAHVWGPAGFNVGFTIDDPQPDGSWGRTFARWDIPGLFTVRSLGVLNRDTGKGFELPITAYFEVLPNTPAPLSPESPIFKVPR